MRISTIALGLTQPVGAAATGGGGVLAFGPSLLLDFVTGEGGTFTPVTDSSMDLNFIDTTYDIASTSSPSYGPGQYFVQV